MISPEELDRRFAYHPATTPQRRDQHESVRAAVKTAAEQLVELVPPGRELATALTKLEEAMFWGNAGVARQGDDAPATVSGSPPVAGQDDARAAISGRPVAG